jgi:hypothetical protein
MACIFFGYMILEYRSRKWILFSGIFVGVAALFGRNHGLYCFMALNILIGFALLKLGSEDGINFLKKYSFFLMGIVIGYSPMLIMFIIIPDFFNSFMHNKVLIYWQREAKYFTTLPKPVPWFWTIDYSEHDFMKGVFYSIQGFLFFIIPIYYLLVFLFIFLKKFIFSMKVYHGLIASAVVGLFYMHHMFARAGLGHLAQGIFPFFISLILFVHSFNKKFETAMFIFILLISLFSVGQSQPYYDKLFNNKKLVSYIVDGDKLWITKRQAKIINTIKKINKKFVKENEGLLIVPHWPVFYPILNRMCPIYNSYLLIAETKQNQLKMIQDLKNNRVNWVILGDYKFDGRDDLRFRNTHKLVFEYIQNNYQIVKVDGLPKRYYLYHKKDGSLS